MDPKTPSWLQMLLGENPESMFEINPGTLMEVGIVGLLLYAGFKVTKGTVDRVMR